MGDSFWKKEISFTLKRPRRAGKRVTDEQEPPPEPAEERPRKRPLWKREIAVSIGWADPDAEPSPPVLRTKLARWRSRHDRRLKKLMEEAAQVVSSSFEPPAALEEPPSAALADAVLAASREAPSRPVAVPDPSAPPAPVVRAPVPAAQLPRLRRTPIRQRARVAPRLPLPRRTTARRLLGLKIGASQLAAARIANDGVPQLERLARQPLPPEVVAAGEVVDVDALADALRSFFRRNGLPRKGVRLGVAAASTHVASLEIVGAADERELAAAIRRRAAGLTPLPLADAVLDHRLVEESTDAHGLRVSRVVVAVAPRALVDPYVAACRAADLRLAGIDLEAFALLRSLAPPTDRGAAALAALAIGYDRSTLAISDGRACELARTLAWGGRSLDVALGRALERTPAEVEAVKRTLSLDVVLAPATPTPDRTALAVGTVRFEVQAFARELAAALDAYRSRPGAPEIGVLAITGGTAQLAGLAEELERSLGLRVRVGNPLARLTIGKRVVAPDQLGSLAVAIGLGIDD